MHPTRAVRRSLSTAFALAMLCIALLLCQTAAPQPLAVADAELAAGVVASRSPGPSRTPDLSPWPAATEQYVSDEVVVKFAPDASPELVEQYLRAYSAPAQAEAARLVPALNAAILKVRAGAVLQTAAALNRAPAVEFAEPNYLVYAHETIPNDPGWSSQYGPINIGAPQAWDITTGGEHVVVAVIDTGVDLGHPDLAGKIWINPGEIGVDEQGGDKRANGVDDDGDGYIDDWRGWDFVNDDNDPQDDHGHGTHVSGIAAAKTNNGVGIAGVSWGARLMPIKVLSSGGAGAYGDLVAGIVWAADHGARIINLSLGGNVDAEILAAAVNYAYDRDVVVVAAAGNAPGLPVSYPAAYPQVIAVASTDAGNNRSPFSAYGPEVDLAAPGSSIYSTYWNGASTYGTLSGTSMATPHVAGVSALLAGLPQSRTAQQIRAALELTALDLGPLGRDYLYGFGLVQAGRAVRLNPETITPSPTPSPTFTQLPPQTYALTTSLTCPPGVDFKWLNAAGGVNTNLREDDLFTMANLPFGFVFDGYTHTSLFISSNGYLTFGSDGTAWNNVAIPNSAAPDMFIAPFWDDLNPKAGGDIYYATFGHPPNRRFVVEWNSVPRYSLSGPNNGEGALTFQVVLGEGQDGIVFQYQALIGPNTSGGSATVGIEFAGGAGGLQYSYNTPGSLREGLAIRLAPYDSLTPTPAPACVPGEFYFPFVVK